MQNNLKGICDSIRQHAPEQSFMRMVNDNFLAGCANRRFLGWVQRANSMLSVEAEGDHKGVVEFGEFSMTEPTP